MKTFLLTGTSRNESKHASEPTVTTPAMTAGTSTAIPAVAEADKPKDPTPEEPLDEVDMFSQALMQLNETNKQVHNFQVFLSQLLWKMPHFLH